MGLNLYKAASNLQAKKAAVTKQARKKAKSSAPSSAGLVSVEPQTINTAGVRMKLARPVRGAKSLGRWVYTQQNNGRVVSGIGQQGVGTILGHNTVSQLVVDTPVPNGLQFKDDVYALNPYQTNTGSGVFASQIAPNQDRITCRHIRAEFMMTNMSNAPAVVTLYWVLSKKAHTSDPMNRWNQFLSETALGQPASTRPVQSNTGVTVGTTGVPDFATFGQEPTTVRAWNQTFKILKKRSYALGFGAVQRVGYSISVNKILDRTVAQQQLTMGNTAYTGATVWLCMVTRGTPVDTSVFEGNPPQLGIDLTSVTTSNPEIAWTASVSYTYTGHAADRLDVNRVTQGFPNIGALAAIDVVGPNGTNVPVINA